MKVFITGATGWIGSATTDALLAAGHDVTALARSDRSAATIAAKGGRVVRGSLDEPALLRSAAEEADAVVHLAYNHDWSDMAAAGATERRSIQTLGDALARSGRALLFATGAFGIQTEGYATEDQPSLAVGENAPRGGGENLALEYVERGVRVLPVRFAPTVHGTGDPNFIWTLSKIARRSGVAGYPGDGTNLWSAVHRSDAAEVIVRGLDRAPAGTRLHAVAEEAIPTREIAEAIGRASNLPTAPIPADEFETHFGWIAGFFSADMATSSEATRRLLDWEPTGPTLFEDIAAGAYAPREDQAPGKASRA